MIPISIFFHKVKILSLSNSTLFLKSSYFSKIAFGEHGIQGRKEGPFLLCWSKRLTYIYEIRHLGLDCPKEFESEVKNNDFWKWQFIFGEKILKINKKWVAQRPLKKQGKQKTNKIAHKYYYNLISYWWIKIWNQFWEVNATNASTLTPERLTFLLFRSFAFLSPDLKHS